MPVVSTFTQYGTILPPDRVPFLRSIGNGKFSEGLASPDGLAPTYWFFANLNTPFSNAINLTQGAASQTLLLNPAFAPFAPYGNNGFDFTNGDITPPISGMYQVNWFIYTASSAGGSVSTVPTSDFVLFSLVYPFGTAQTVWYQTFVGDGFWSTSGGAIVRLDKSTAGGFPDYSLFRIIALLDGPVAGTYPLLGNLSCHFVAHL